MLSQTDIRYCFQVTEATAKSWIFPLKIQSQAISVTICAFFMSITSSYVRKKNSVRMKEKSGEKPKIQITDSVKISNHSTVFSVFESPNLKPIH